MSETQNQRRRFSGLVVNRQAQFKLAVACSSLLLIPTLVISIAMIADLGSEPFRFVETGEIPAALAQSHADRALGYCVTLLLVYFVFSAVSIYLSLKLSNHIVGPVGRLENHVKSLIKGEYQVQSNLRKNDYLKDLGDLINELTHKLKGKS